MFHHKEIHMHLPDRAPSSHSLRFLAMLLAWLLPITGVLAQAKEGPRREPEANQLPGLRVDRDKKIVEIEGKIILPLQAEWLELLACAPKSREHESIISLDAKPSHIHGALILIGLKAGSPLRAERVGDEWRYHQPTGPKLAVTVHYELDGKKFDVPVNEWVMDQKTKKPLPDNIWLFTGSKIYEIDGRGVYIADIEGNILSLVNFGDEVLARVNDKRGGQGGGGGNEAWAANAKAIPVAGTKIILRLTPVPDEEKKDEKKEETK